MCAMQINSVTTRIRWTEKQHKTECKLKCLTLSHSIRCESIFFDRIFFWSLFWFGFHTINGTLFCVLLNKKKLFCLSSLMDFSATHFCRWFFFFLQNVKIRDAKRKINSNRRCVRISSFHIIQRDMRTQKKTKRKRTLEQSSSSPMNQEINERRPNSSSDAHYVYCLCAESLFFLLSFCGR